MVLCTDCSLLAIPVLVYVLFNLSYFRIAAMHLSVLSFLNMYFISLQYTLPDHRGPSRKRKQQLLFSAKVSTLRSFAVHAPYFTVYGVCSSVTCLFLVFTTSSFSLCCYSRKCFEWCGMVVIVLPVSDRC